MLLLAGIAMISLTGCSSVHTGVASAPLVEKLDPAVHTPQVKVGEKISGESSAKVLFGFITFGGDNQYVDGMSYTGATSIKDSLPIPVPSLSSGMDDVKSAAAYKAITNSGADVIVAPTYKTTVKNDYFVYKELEAKVEGYKGIITGFTQKN